MRPRLTESQLARLSGSPEPEVPEVVESPPEPTQKAEQNEQPRDLPQVEIKAEAVVEDEVETKPEAAPQPKAPEESDKQEPEPPLAEQPPAEQPSQAETARPTPPTPAPEKPAGPQQPAEQEPKLMPSSSLGGSARELLNSDGRLRKP